MSLTNIIVTVLLLLICTISIAVILYWHTATRGTWRQWPAGQSLMALLMIIAAGFGWGGVNRMLGDYALKQPVLAGLYGIFAVGLVMIGVTIHKELAAGKARLIKDDATPDTGLVAIVVATKTEEDPDGKH